MPLSLPTQNQSPEETASSTVDRVNALLDWLEPDAIESAWEEASRSVTSRPPTAAPAGGDPQQRILAEALSQHLLLPLFDPPADAPLPIDPALAQRVEEAFCRQHRLAPLAEQNETLEVAVASRDVLRLATTFQQRFGRQLRPLVATSDVIERVLTFLYPAERTASLGSEADRPSTTSARPDPSRSAAEVAPQSRGLRALLSAALRRGATAIHLDRLGEEEHVRFRVNGQLVAWRAFRKGQLPSLVAEIKSRARFAHVDTRRAVSGMFTLRKGSVRRTVRVEVCPAVNGERVVLQFENLSGAASVASPTGLTSEQHAELQRWLRQGSGLVLVSGPRIRELNATLDALLAEAQHSHRSLAVLSSGNGGQPAHVLQFAVDQGCDASVEAAFSTFSRQDLDLLVIREIQSGKAFELCLRGSAKGPVMLAGLPASSPTALQQQLSGWGMSNAFPSPPIRGIVYQRLLRKLCPHCRAPQSLGPARLQRYGLSPACTIYQPVGCHRCDGFGFHGRLRVATLCHGGALRAEAAKGLWRAALCRVAAGETGLEEALRVADHRPLESLR